MDGCPQVSPPPPLTSRVPTHLDSTLRIRNTQIEAALAEFFDESLARHGQFYGYAASGDLAARDEARHDGGVPACRAFHGCKAGALVGVVEQVHNRLFLLTILDA